MHRRTFLRTVGATAGVGLLGTACGGSGLPAVGEATDLNVQQASFEFLTGERWIAFGVSDPVDNARIESPVQVYLRTLPTEPGVESEQLAGPLEATFSPADETGQGVHYVRGEFPEEGFYEIVVEEGGRFGAAPVQVVAAANSQVAVPGDDAIPAPTPTEEDDMGVFSICTLNPPCGMHELSLDEALETGRPVALMFATPQFCQTAVCGPGVQILEEVRQDFGDVVFVHSEIFAEEPQGATVQATPVTAAVEAWSLPSEPWFFTIDADGTIIDRVDGPMPAPVLRSLLEELTA